jgi:hypothetical protein
MNVSRSFVRCGVLVVYFDHMPWAMAEASVLVLLEDLLGRETGVDAVVPASAVVRCLGAIVGGIWMCGDFREAVVRVVFVSP